MQGIQNCIEQAIFVRLVEPLPQQVDHNRWQDARQIVDKAEDVAPQPAQLIDNNRQDDGEDKSWYTPEQKEKAVFPGGHKQRVAQCVLEVAQSDPLRRTNQVGILETGDKRVNDGIDGKHKEQDDGGQEKEIGNRIAP